MVARARPKRPRVELRAEIDALPEHLIGEIIAGELVVSPRPRLRHASTAGGLHFAIAGPFRFGVGGPGGWVILEEPELSLGVDPDFDPIIPDLAGWRRERLAEVPDLAAATIAPDWICEILSPSTQITDRAHKLPFYARAQVDWAWVVTVEAKMIEVFERRGDQWLVHSVVSGDAAIAIPPFEAVPLDLARVWSL